MNKSLIRLTRKISLVDLVDENQWIWNYTIYLEECFFNPIQKLSSEGNSDYWITELCLLLLFFEHHAEYITWESSSWRSKKFFKNGFNAYYDYIADIYDLHDRPDWNSLYAFWRCWLMHSLSFKNTNFLIDSIDCTNLPFTKRSSFRLINNSSLLSSLKSYSDNYLALLNWNENMLKKFKATFRRNIYQPMKTFEH